MFVKINSERLKWLRHNQFKWRLSDSTHVCDLIADDANHKDEINEWTCQSTSNLGMCVTEAEVMNEAVNTRHDTWCEWDMGNWKKAQMTTMSSIICVLKQQLHGTYTENLNYLTDMHHNQSDETAELWKNAHYINLRNTTARLSPFCFAAASSKKMRSLSHRSAESLQ